MRALRLAVATAILLASGCVPRLAVTPGDQWPGLAEPGAWSEVGQPHGAADEGRSIPPGHGALRIAVRWPARFATQTIPTNTAAIALQIKGPRELHFSLTPAQPATESILPAGDYALSAVARDAEGAETASGSIDVTVLTGQIVNAGLTLAPYFVPALTSYQPNGGPGELITLRGRNFARSGVGNAPFVVRFGAVEASEIFLKSDSEALVRVPGGAVSGDLSVVANGVPSTGSYPFEVIASLELFSHDPEAIVTPGNGRPTVVFFAGQGRPATSASVSLGAIVKDAGGKPIANPYVTWRVLGDHSDFMSVDPATGSAATISVQPGSFAGPGSATGTVVVESGSVSASVDYVIYN